MFPSSIHRNLLQVPRTPAKKGATTHTLCLQPLGQILMLVADAAPEVERGWLIATQIFAQQVDPTDNVLPRCSCLQNPAVPHAPFKKASGPADFWGEDADERGGRGRGVALLPLSRLAKRGARHRRGRGKSKAWKLQASRAQNGGFPWVGNPKGSPKGHQPFDYLAFWGMSVCPNYF